MFKQIDSKKIYEDAWLKFYVDGVEFPNGEKGTYAWADRKPGIAVVVVDENRKVLLGKEYRYVTRASNWEIPGGGIDKGETLEQAARREVKEETGIEVTTLRHLGRYYPLNSYNTETVDLFLAPVPSSTPHTRGTEHAELISDQKFVSFEEAFAMMDRGEIVDAMTANALQIAYRKLSL